MSIQENNLIRGVALNNGQVGQIDYNFLANQPTIKGQPAAGELSKVLALKGETSEIHTGSDEPPAGAKVWIDPNGDEAVSLPETVEQVVKEYMEENPVSLPEKLPNPYKLILTGAIDAEYDGSEEIKVEIPAGGGAVSPEAIKQVVDAYLEENPPEGGIPIPSSAQVGQTIVVKAVDETGKPTEWDAADLPSGEKKTKLITIVDFTAEQDLVFSSNGDGNNLNFGDACVAGRHFFYLTPEGQQLKAKRIYGYMCPPLKTTFGIGFSFSPYYRDGQPDSWSFGDYIGNNTGICGWGLGNTSCPANNYAVFEFSATQPILVRSGVAQELAYQFQNIKPIGFKTMDTIIPYFSGVKIVQASGTFTLPTGTKIVIKAEVEEDA